jgi:hypothetical protein
LRDGTAVAERRMLASPVFDLSIAEVIAYENLTIVVFQCECRWVVMLDRPPMVVACPGHGGTSSDDIDE